MSRSLLVFPDDSSRPLLNAIAAATKSLRIKMFVFSDPALIEAVIAARKRGVYVRVILNSARRSGKEENQECSTTLANSGIDVLSGNPVFDLTHEKSMVVDDNTAYVMSLNWQTKNLTETRDYAVVTSHKHEVSEITQCFDADWSRTTFTPGEHSHLIWCVGNGRQRLTQMIDSAKHSIWLQNERYQDQTIIEHLVRARRRDIQLHIMAPPPHKLKKDKLIEGISGLRILADVGGKIHKLRHIKLHGKMLVVDGARAIIGSINLAPGSFDSRRELAISLDDPDAIKRLNHVVHSDWESSHALDLSDQGLLAELEDYDSGVNEHFGIGSKPISTG